ncbi:lipid storage droplets surface-binding protein 2-like [Neodiprion fabricii]|uniref:lipid storage droplets surface-binding protein 2-like n=1 Tax=Neodiprion fabricii TaxID=2872261 RepID=UPI001ED8F58D|nr:lipid storage droplets surface-binding protein 2-like [Neodiprion fabricii]XP_046422543.1 lipid storage droplets surface-binding protein 2-like [Neodiprion fabricii]
MDRSWEKSAGCQESTATTKTGSYKIQALDRALEIPSVHYLWDKSAQIYSRVKGANTVVHRALDTVEHVVCLVVEKTCTPVVRLMEKPIFNLDQTLCQGINFVQVKLPIIKEDPKQIIDRTKLIVLESIRPAVRTLKELKEETEDYVSVMKIRTHYKVHYLRMYSWEQADRFMSTETGVTILKTVDNTTEMAKLLLDKYLPAPEEEDFYNADDGCTEHDNLHHTMLRLSEFSSRASRRIYFALMDKLQHMYKIEIIVLILYALVVIQVVKVLEILLTVFLKILNYSV